MGLYIFIVYFIFLFVDPTQGLVQGLAHLLIDVIVDHFAVILGTEVVDHPLDFSEDIIITVVVVLVVDPINLLGHSVVEGEVVAEIETEIIHLEQEVEVDEVDLGIVSVILRQGHDPGRILGPEVVRQGIAVESGLQNAQ